MLFARCMGFQLTGLNAPEEEMACHTRLSGKAAAWARTCRGQSPDSTLNREDFPQPFGPMTNTERPTGTSKVSSRTKGVPSGALSATLQPYIAVTPCLTGPSDQAISPSACRHEQANVLQVVKACMMAGQQMTCGYWHHQPCRHTSGDFCLTGGHTVSWRSKGSSDAPLEADDVASHALGLRQRLEGLVIEQLGAGHVAVVQ